MGLSSNHDEWLSKYDEALRMNFEWNNIINSLSMIEARVPATYTEARGHLFAAIEAFRVEQRCARERANAVRAQEPPIGDGS